MSAKRLQETVLEVDLMLNNIRIWDRDFDLNIIYDCYKGEDVLEAQKEALKSFLANKGMIAASKTDVESYCLNHNRADIGSNTIDNIFKYVIPESILVKRDGCVAIMCRYRYDEEHGIAVVFSDGKVKEVGSQDIIL